MLRDAAPIVRLYLKTGSVRIWRLMDVALLRAQHGQGIGTALMRSLLRYADGLGGRSACTSNPSTRPSAYTSAWFLRR